MADTLQGELEAAEEDIMPQCDDYIACFVMII